MQKSGAQLVPRERVKPAMEQSDCARCSFGARTGFAFDLCRRNATLIERLGLLQPKMRKTGTTIVGVVCDGAVVLAADTRATEGPLVADKNTEKIHYIAPNMVCFSLLSLSLLCCNFF